ncbi:MAG: DNA repair protein RecN [Caldilineaceae bacterium]
MLHELRIRNFAIIDQLELSFAPGLNILTGETGAGKSIILDALGMLLGNRAGTEWIRAGTEMAAIEGQFQLPEDSDVTVDLRHTLEEQGLDDTDNPNWLVVAREVRANGRNVCRINGRAVSLQILEELTSRLVDIHGQGEHLNLLRPKTHIHLLDRYANLLPLRKQVAAEVSQLRAVRTELQRLRNDARTVAQRLDLLSFQVGEIFDAALTAGEDSELESERRRLANAESLTKLATTAAASLHEGDYERPSAVDLISDAVGNLERLARIDPDMQQAALDGQVLLEQISDLARTLQDYAEELEFNPERLAEVEERLELISNLKRKYGDTIEQILEFGKRAQRDLEELSNWEAKSSDLEKREEQLLRKIGTLASELSNKRKSAGEQMAHQVEVELGDLRMNKARFGVIVEQRNDAEGAILADGRRVAFDGTGIDQVEFMISANPGEPLKPLAKVASGGETARIMLALKGVLTHADATPTLIFDEIDQGIGGRVGAIVGQKLWMLTGQKSEVKSQKPKGNSQKSATVETLATVAHQVLCITHLPQLAAFGDSHFTVNKQVVNVNGEERTKTVVTNLEGDARIRELMQMLGAESESGRKSVEEMIKEVATAKESK